MNYRFFRLLLRLVAVLAAGLVVAGGLLAWRLSAGPLEIGMLAPSFSRGLSDAMGGLAVEVGPPALTWSGFGRAFDLRLPDVVVRDDLGQPLVRLADVAVSFSATALLSGRLQPSVIELVRPNLRAVLAEDGSLTLGIGDSAALSLDRLLSLATPDPSNRQGAPLRFAVRDGAVRLDDRLNGRLWQAVDVNLTIIAAGATGPTAPSRIGMVSGLSLILDGRPVPFTATASYSATAGPASDRPAAVLDGRLVAPELRMGEALALARIGLPEGWHASGEFAAELDFRLRGGRLESLAVGARGRDGVIANDQRLPRPLSLASLEARGHWRPATGSWGLDRLVADLGEFRLAAQGSLRPAVDATSLTGGAGADGDAVDPDAVVVAPDAATMQAGFRLAGEVFVQDIPMDMAKALLPDVASGGEVGAWVDGNLADGRFTRIALAVEAQSPGDSPFAFAAPRISGSFDYSGVTVHYFRQLDAARDVAGSGTFSPEQLDLDIVSGDIAGLSIGHAQLSLTGLDTAFPVGQADLVVRGQTAQFLRVMDRPPLGIASRLGLPPADVAGRAAWRLRVGFPVGPARPGSETRVIAAANLSGLSLPNIGGGLPLDDGSFHMIVSNDGMRLEGQGLVAGIPAEVGVRQSFVRGAPVPRQTRLRAVLDDAGRAALGLPGGDLLRGVVGIDATLSERAAAPTAALVSLDLSSATFDVPPLGWRKPPDMPAEARLTFDLTAVADGPPAIAAIDTIRLVAGDPAAGGMLATGAVTLAPDGAVDSLTLRELRVGQTDARGQMRLAADGVWLIDVEGNSLDVGGLLNTGDDDQAATAAATTADDRPATVPPMRLSVRVSSLWLGPGQLVDQALLAADHDGVRLARLDLSGQVGRGAPLLVQLTPVAGGRALRVHSDDAGAALRALGLFDRVFGGRMEVRAAYDDSQDPALMTGRLQMVDFRTVSDPVVARIAALMEIDAAEEFLVGEIGFTFASLIVPFTRLGDIITISEGRAVGAQLGLSADGTIDLSADTLDIEGTAAPIYAINSVVGRIPILGPLIAGGQDEGLFAATYTARGSLAEPDVSVNVLSVFTPGLLRNIFGIFTGDPSTVDVPPLDADNRR